MKKEKINIFNKDCYLLGMKDGIKYYLEKASWDCDWYWGFGYVVTFTNNKCPARSKDIASLSHFDIMFPHYKNFVDEWKNSPLNKEDRWTMYELMQTAYTLREAADCISRGSAHISTNPCQDIIKDENISYALNKKILPAVLNEIESMLTPNE